MRDRPSARTQSARGRGRRPRKHRAGSPRSMRHRSPRASRCPVEIPRRGCTRSAVFTVVGQAAGNGSGAQGSPGGTGSDVAMWRGRSAGAAPAARACAWSCPVLPGIPDFTPGRPQLCTPPSPPSYPSHSGCESSESRLRSHPIDPRTRTTCHASVLAALDEQALADVPGALGCTCTHLADACGRCEAGHDPARVRPPRDPEPRVGRAHEVIKKVSLIPGHRLARAPPARLARPPSSPASPRDTSRSRAAAGSPAPRTRRGRASLANGPAPGRPGLIFISSRLGRAGDRHEPWSRAPGAPSARTGTSAPSDDHRAARALHGDGRNVTPLAIGAEARSRTTR